MGRAHPAKDEPEEYDPAIRARMAPHLINALIDKADDPAGYLARGMQLMALCNTALERKHTVTVCGACARKMGVKRCAACPRDNGLRYCSRACQVAHWPQHRTVCGVSARDVLAVD